MHPTTRFTSHNNKDNFPYFIQATRGTRRPPREDLPKGHQTPQTDQTYKQARDTGTPDTPTTTTKKVGLGGKAPLSNGNHSNRSSGRLRVNPTAQQLHSGVRRRAPLRSRRAATAAAGTAAAAEKYTAHHSIAIDQKPI